MQALGCDVELTRPQKSEEGDQINDPSEMLSKMNLKICQRSVALTKVRTRLLLGQAYCSFSLAIPPGAHSQGEAPRDALLEGLLGQGIPLIELTGSGSQLRALVRVDSPGEPVDCGLPLETKEEVLSAVQGRQPENHGPPPQADEQDG